MSRLRYCALLALLWAGIYLPGMGSSELRGEEGRRVLPAIHMLETGNWLVPYVGGKPFLRKPPLVNWAIAGSFKLFGVRNEWAARFPSAFCVLLLGLAIVLTAQPASSSASWLSPGAAFVAAIIAMTFAGLLAKARFAGAEIEGIYVPLSGMAIVCWLAWWSRGCSPWLYWTIPGVLLGLASLAKGPSFHLVFYYAVVCAALWQASRLRHLFHPAHFFGLALCAGIFAAWAVPYFQSPEAAEAAAVWKRQGIDRFTDSDFNPGNYFLNLPRALSDLLPWLLLAPCLRRLRDLPSLRRVLIVSSIVAVGILLVPGTLPRYVLPFGVVFAIALAKVVEESEAAIGAWFFTNRALAVIILPIAFAAPLMAGYPTEKGASFDLARALRAGLASTSAIACCTLVFARRRQELTASWTAGASAMLFGGAMLVYAGAPGWFSRMDTFRPIAAQIDAAVPPGATIILHDPGYQPWIFYLRSPYTYAVSFEDIPLEAGIVVARGESKTRRKFAEDRPDLELVQTLKSKTGAEYLIYKRLRPPSGRVALRES